MDDWIVENAEALYFAVAFVILWVVADRIRDARKRLRKNERRRFINTLRGAVMSKSDLDKTFMMRFEDAIENEIQDLRWEGRMNETQEREYREMFADFGLIGLYPMRDIKRGIQRRLKQMAEDIRLGKGRPLAFLNGNASSPAKAAPKKKISKFASNEGA